MTVDDLEFDADTFRTTAEQGGIYDATNPDLSAFRARGGKLILWHGWGDPAISPYGTVAYHHALTQRMGGRPAAERFARRATTVRAVRTKRPISSRHRPR
jgi:feruloyl esterase